MSEKRHTAEHRTDGLCPVSAIGVGKVRERRVNTSMLRK